VTGPRDAVRRRPLVAFWLLTIAASWAYWVPLAVWAPEVSHFPGLLGPAVAALALTGLLEGRSGVRALLGRMARWRAPARLWLLALLPLGAAGAALAGLALAGRGLPDAAALTRLPGVPDLGLLGLLAVVLVVNGLGEETGWRGFAWPRLRAGRDLLPAAALLAVPWAVWHLPLFWLATGQRDFPLLVVPGWLVGLLAGAVVLGWLYERSGSLLVVAVFHSALNLASATAATEGVPAAAASAVVLAGAVLLLRGSARERPGDLLAQAAGERDAGGAVGAHLDHPHPPGSRQRLDQR
jgi:uncharacterized protein